MVGVTWEQAIEYAFRMAATIGCRYKVVGHWQSTYSADGTWTLSGTWLYRAVALDFQRLPDRALRFDDPLGALWRGCAHRSDFASAAEHGRDCPAHGADATCRAHGPHPHAGRTCLDCPVCRPSVDVPPDPWCECKNPDCRGECCGAGRCACTAVSS